VGTIILLNAWYLLMIPIVLATALVGLWLTKVLPWQRVAAELARIITDRNTVAFRKFLTEESGASFMRLSTVLLTGYAKKGDLEAVRFMLDNGTIGADKAFVTAAGEDQLEVMEWLLQRGIVIDYFERNWPTALMTAAHVGREKAVRFLIEHGASPNVRKSDGMTALTMARRRGHHDVARYLEEHGATA